MAGTIKEIAEKAGVSRGTVDRALNNRGRINPEVAEKIKTIAKEMNYVPKKKDGQRRTNQIRCCDTIGKIFFMIPIRSGLQAVIGDQKRNIDCFLEEIDGVDEAAQLQALERLLELGVKELPSCQLIVWRLGKKSISLRNKALRSSHLIRTLLVVNVNALSEWITLKAGRQLLDY